MSDNDVVEDLIKEIDCGRACPIDVFDRAINTINCLRASNKELLDALQLFVKAYEYFNGDLYDRAAEKARAAIAKAKA